MAPRTPRARLLVTCADTSGIVATVTTFLFNQGVNVTHLDQHTAPAGSEAGRAAGNGAVFFMRVEFTAIAGLNRKTFEAAFSEVVAKRYGMSWRFAWDDQVKRVGLFVSKHDHALMELLWRSRRGELPCEIAMIIGNHPESRRAADDFGLPFHLVSYDQGPDAAEDKILELTSGLDLLVLARFMRILSPRVVDAFPSRIINIHHSFLPAFAGARPYHQAWDRGVKVIGATAHYVTAELDCGPIIEQDTLRVSHRHSADELVSLGRDVERQVLARAVLWHLEDRVIVHMGKTVVFT